MILAIACGGAVGAVMRHAMNLGVMSLAALSFPAGILMVNILGCLVMGVFTGLFAAGWDVSQAMKAFLTVGILGGFTTFSAFSLDTVLLLEKGQYMAAGAYVSASVICSILALFLGLWLARVVMT